MAGAARRPTWGPPKPRKAVLEAWLVRQQCPVHDGRRQVERVAAVRVQVDLQGDKLALSVAARLQGTEVH